MTHKAGAGLSQLRVGRYVLDDLVAEGPGTQFWRATDPALARPVGARLIPVDAPHAHAVREAARRAASVHDRRIVQVLDVVESDTHLAVITEWVNGRPLCEVLPNSDKPDDAVVVAYEVARALQEAHRKGVTHGRLRPSSVLITETLEVRLRGLGVDAALYGVAPGTNPRRADLHGIGAVLYLGLTGWWPDPDADGLIASRGAVDGIPVIGPVGRRLPTPSEVAAGIPASLSSLAAGCMLTSQRQRLRRQVPDIDHAVTALTRAVEQMTGATPYEDPTPSNRTNWTDRSIHILAGVVVAAIAVSAIMLFGESLAQQAAPADNPVRTVAPAQAPVPRGTTGPIAEIPIVAAVDFDPEGADRSENPHLVRLSYDKDPETAWQTVRYKHSTMQPKSGTGLLLDLGLSRPISAVSVALVGKGSSVEILTGQEAGGSAEDFALFAGAVAADSEIVLRTPSPVVTRYVLVWLTNLPYSEGAYQGGVREVRVLG